MKLIKRLSFYTTPLFLYVLWLIWPEVKNSFDNKRPFDMDFVLGHLNKFEKYHLLNLIFWWIVYYNLFV